MLSTFTKVPGLNANAEETVQLQGDRLALPVPAPSPGTQSLDAPNSVTSLHLASRSLSRSNSWHCLARYSVTDVFHTNVQVA